MAQRVVEAFPDHVTTERSKAKRGTRVYVDVIQNAKGHHAVPPYVFRAVPGAPVSTPLHWRELTPHLDPRSYTLKTIFRRLAGQQRDPMAQAAARGDTCAMSAAGSARYCMLVRPWPSPGGCRPQELHPRGMHRVVSRLVCRHPVRICPETMDASRRGTQRIA